MKKFFVEEILVWCGVAFGISAILYSFVIYAQWYSVSPSGSDSLLNSSMFIFLFLIFMAVVLVLPFSIGGMIFERVRRLCFLLSLSCLVYIATAFLCFRIGNSIRLQAFHRLAERSTSLIKSVNDFEARYGHPPENLEELVPEFLPSVPNTGMAAYPKYHYMVGERARQWDGNLWVLYVDTPSGGLNWDMFMYFPNQNYPKRGYGGSLERIEDWAYVHE